MQYVIGLTADPNHVNRPRFNIASGAAEEMLKGRAEILGWHEDEPGDLLVEIFDDSVLEELAKANFVERMPIAGHHPMIFPAQNVINHEDNFSPGGTI